ncbi:MAG: TetR/AcrR family transcriptional regulator [Halieaceae bacterium]|jgi:AcrR family transcriptional regulator|nr:TetR/AcrR family transcriptional regulator [Halieaceae bacterium]
MVAVITKEAGNKKPTRAQRTAQVRELVFCAAATVVGNNGYADASIREITENAGIAQGTFYLYFKSRQDLFDQLLPHIGGEMVEFIRKRVVGSNSFFEVEESGFRAFFEFLQENPGFFRVLNEAEIYAPKGHRKHFRNLIKPYLDSMRRSVQSGEIANSSDDELEALIYIFLSARSYLYMRYLKTQRKKSRELPEWVVNTYMNFIRNGLG